MQKLRAISEMIGQAVTSGGGRMMKLIAGAKTAESRGNRATTPLAERQTSAGRQSVAAVLLLALILPVALPVPALAYREPTAEEQFAARMFETPAALAGNSFYGAAFVSSWLNSIGVTSNLTNAAAGGENVVESESASAATAVEAMSNEQIPPPASSGKKPTGERIRMIAGKPAAASASFLKSSRASAAPLMPPPDVQYPIEELPPAEQQSVFDPQNNIGNPPGQTEPSAPNFAASTNTKERPGIADFSFGIPVAGLPGRAGSGVSLAAVYHSRVWNKYDSPNNGTSYTYDVGGSSLAPGFSLHMGYVERVYVYQNNSYVYRPFSIVSPDGTRHRLVDIGGGKYETDDGSFIRVTGGGEVASFTDGSLIHYAHKPSEGRWFPQTIRDRNGNQTRIDYRPGDTEGKMTIVTDARNAHIRFYYDAQGSLSYVTAPGYNGAEERETVRFFYETQSLASGSMFANATINAPTEIKVIRRVYFAGTHSGYEYDYSPYGMIATIRQMRGMAINIAGQLVTPGEQAASTAYDYPDTLGTPLTDVPQYHERTDTWAGSTHQLPAVVEFEVVEDAPCLTEAAARCRVTRITSPDKAVPAERTVTESYAYTGEEAGQEWRGGLLRETRVTTPSSGKVWAQTINLWEKRADDLPYIKTVYSVDDAHQARATTFDYDLYFNPTTVSERDFAPLFTLGTELRRVETSYVHQRQASGGAGWIANRLLHLPETIKLIVGSAVVNRTDYEYDNYGGGNTLLGRANVLGHDPAAPATVTVSNEEASRPDCGLTPCADGCVKPQCCQYGTCDQEQKPNLMISSISATPSNPISAGTINFAVEIYNNGGTPSSGDHRVLLQEDNACFTTGCAVGIFNGTIAPRSGVSVNISGGWVATDQGTHIITATVDDQNMIEESNEGDNALPITINVGAATNFRGNVTKTTTYADAQEKETGGSGGAESSAARYDILGNVVEATVICCRLKTWEYLESNQYAFPTKMKRGDDQSFISSIEYDAPTGLVKKTVDENGQATLLDYDPPSLRLIRSDYSNGGYALIAYHDELNSGEGGKRLTYIEMTGTLEAGKTVSGRQYVDGRGAVVRTFGQLINGTYQNVTDTQYDAMGRITQTSSPYQAASFTSGINPSNKWTRPVYDALGRSPIVTLPDTTTIQTAYHAAVVNVSYPDSGLQVKGLANIATDQANKQRRQILDALGRVIRTDEPNSSVSTAENGLGTLESPAQPTFFSYDGNGKLIKIIQKAGDATQIREFRYDNLTRLLRERQPEAAATLDDNGVRGVPANNKWTGVYKYNEFGLREWGVDARGIKSTFSYDSLNRAESITYTADAASGNTTPQINYTYDEVHAGFFNKGRLTKITTASNGDSIPATVQLYDYDKTGQIVKQTQEVGGNSYSLSYSYNLSG